MAGNDLKVLSIYDNVSCVKKLTHSSGETVQFQIDYHRLIVAGCGAMGLPMAKALIDAGFTTACYDVKSLQDQLPGEHILDSLKDLDSKDILFIVVRDFQQIREICFEKEKVFNNPQHPEKLIICSTISPLQILELKGLLPEDVELIDAPMSGAPVAAEEKTLTFMIGGDKEQVENLHPVFEAMGKSMFHIGPISHGMSAKVLNNYMAACSVVSVRMGLHHAARLGIDSATILDVVQRSSGQNWFASNIDKIDWAHEVYGQDNTIGILEKDVLAAIDAMHDTSPDSDNFSTEDSTGEKFGKAIIEALRQLPSIPD